MATVLVGGVSPEGERLIQSYLDYFMPNAEIVALKPVGIKGKVKNQGSRADTVMIILDEDLYSQCVGIADSVLNNPKTHRYTDDAGLKQFLISKFGKLDDSETDEDVSRSNDISDFPDDSVSHTEEIVSSDDTFSKSEEDTSFEPEPEELSPELQSIISSNVEDEDMDADLSISYISESSEEDEKSNNQLVTELRDELIRKETMIESLTAQLQESSSASADVKDFISRIKELEEENSVLKEASSTSADIDSAAYYQALGKVTRAEQVIKEFDELKASVNREKENVSALTFAKETLENNIVELNKKIELYEAQVEDAKKVRDDFNRVQIELEDKSSTCAELEKQVAELSESVADKENLEQKLSEYEGYKAQFEDTTQLLKDCEKERDEFKLKLDENITKYEETVEELKGVREELQKTIDDLESKKVELSDVWKSYNDSDEKVKELQSKIDELNSSISTSSVNSEELEKKILELTSQLDETKANVNSLTSELESTKKQLKDAQSEAELTQISLDTNKEALDSLLEEKADVEQKLVNAEQGRKQLAEDVVEKANEIEKLKSDMVSAIEEKENEISDLKSKAAEQEIELQHLREKASDADATSADKERLEAEILELRKTNARINSELEIKNKNEASSNSAELKLEIIKLKEQLELAKNKSEVSDSEELSSLRSEIDELNKKVTNLELDIVDRDEQLQEYESNIFLKLGNTSSMKSKVVTSLSFDAIDFKSKFIVTCSATGESTSEAYDLIKKTCLKNSQKHILIVDLTNDSYIDQCMMTNGAIKVPMGWLQGQESFKGYAVNAGVQGCAAKVISCGISYINTLAFLNVDWNKRLQELDGAADIIILHVGCLDNVVTKILFNTFMSLMPGHIVVKATPINLRTAILNILGLPNSKDVIADCVGMISQSKEFYAKLSERCKTNIIKPNEGMNI